MTCNDRRLQHVEAVRAAQLLRACQGRKPALDQQTIPARPVLLQQQNRFAFSGRARRGARGVKLHQAHEAVRLRLPRRQRHQNAAEAQRFLAQLRAHPIVASRRGVAFIEDEIDHPQHGREALRQLRSARRLIGEAGFRQRALGAHDPLRDRGLGCEKGARDLFGCQSCDHAQRQRRARLRRKQRVASGKDQPQHVVADVVVQSSVEIRRGVLLGFQLVHQGRMLAFEHLVAPEVIDGPALGGGQQPGAGFLRHARVRPPLECGDQRLLRQLFGKRYVARHPCQHGDEPGLFDSPNGEDGAMRVGDRHGRRLSHPPGRRKVRRSRPAQRHLTHFTIAFLSFSMRLVEVHECDDACERLGLERQAPSASKPAAARRTSSGKSAISWTCRTSITSLSPPGQRLAHSMASSRDAAWIIQ